MTTYDLSPLFRTAIGFDRMARLIDTAQDAASAPAYPALQHRQDRRERPTA